MVFRWVCGSWSLRPATSSSAPWARLVPERSHGVRCQAVPCSRWPRSDPGGVKGHDVRRLSCSRRRRFWFGCQRTEGAAWALWRKAIPSAGNISNFRPESAAEELNCRQSKCPISVCLYICLSCLFCLSALCLSCFGLCKCLGLSSVVCLDHPALILPRFPLLRCYKIMSDDKLHEICSVASVCAVVRKPGAAVSTGRGVFIGKPLSGQRIQLWFHRAVIDDIPKAERCL